jgi:hypothetical protein
MNRRSTKFSQVIFWYGAVSLHSVTYNAFVLTSNDGDLAAFFVCMVGVSDRSAYNIRLTITVFNLLDCHKRGLATAAHQNLTFYFKFYLYNPCFVDERATETCHFLLAFVFRCPFVIF